jgi:hypothetical protein
MDDVVPVPEPAPVRDDLDALMGSLRGDVSDVSVLFEALRTKLVDALGSRVTTRDDRARRHRPAARTVTVSLGEHVFEATLSESQLSLFDRQRVRGVTLRSDELDLSTWLSAFVAALRSEAARSDATRAALERLLIG